VGEEKLPSFPLILIFIYYCFSPSEGKIKSNNAKQDMSLVVAGNENED
jgi:hypothetical protein